MLSISRFGQLPSKKTGVIFSRVGGPGNADGEGRKAHFMGIEPVHFEWTIVDGWRGRTGRGQGPVSAMFAQAGKKTAVTTQSGME